MKIVNQRVAFLLDYEVLQHLRELKDQYNWTFTVQDDAKGKAKKKRSTSAGPGLEVVTRDVTLYLEKNGAGTIPSQENFVELMTFLNTLDLMKVEKLQIVNSLPRSMVHLYGLVEECDQRFSEDVCELILAKINDLMPVEQEEQEEEPEEES